VDKVYSHRLETLLELAELQEQLKDDMNGDRALAQNWFIVKQWNESKRYIASGLKGKDLFEAIAGANGVLAWIKQRW